MSQAEVYEFLKRNKGEFNSEEIALGLDKPIAIINRSLRKLRRFQLVSFRVTSTEMLYWV